MKNYNKKVSGRARPCLRHRHPPAADNSAGGRGHGWRDGDYGDCDPHGAGGDVARDRGVAMVHRREPSVRRGGDNATVTIALGDNDDDDSDETRTAPIHHLRNHI